MSNKYLTEFFSQQPVNTKPKEYEGTNWDNFKDNLYNAFEQIGDITEYWFGGGEGAQSGLMAASSIIYENIFGKDKIKEINETDFGKWMGTIYTTDTPEFQQMIKNFQIEQKDRRQTKTFAESETLEDYLSVAAGSIINALGSVAYNLGTAGTGFLMEFTTDNFIEANKIKAKSKGLTLDQLVNSGDAEISAPLKIGALQAGLEYFGFKKIMAPLKGTGVDKAYKKAVGNRLTKLYNKNKNVRVGLDIFSAAGTEALTEMGQTALEIYNKELAIANAEGKDINPFMTFTDAFLSPQGIEAGLQGFFGGGGLKGTAYSAKALNNIRKSSEELDVEKELSNLVDLTRRLNNTDDLDIKSALKKEINKTKKTLKNKIKKGNDIYSSLTDKDIKNIESLSDLADVSAFRINQLVEKLENNDISQQDFDLAVKGLNEQYNKNKSAIIDILYKKNIEFAKEQGDKIGKEIVEIQTKEDYQEQYDKLRTEKDFEGDVKNTDGFIKGNKIYINTLTAKETGAISVGSHELLHGIIGNHIDKLSDSDAAKLGKQFMSTLNSKQQQAVRNRLQKYGLEGDSIFTKKGVNEMFTALSDAVVKEEITFNETFGQKIKFATQDFLRKIFKAVPGLDIDYTKEFSDGRQAYDFVKEYNQNIKQGKLGKRALDFAKQNEDAIIIKKSLSSEAKQQITDNVQEIGDTYSFEGGKKAWDEGGADNAITEIKQNNYLDDLIAAKFKGDRVPVDFVDKVYTELTNHIRNFNPETNDNLFGWINSQLANKAGNVFNKEYKTTTEQRTARDVDDRTKEGEVKVQVADETDVTLEALETEDISPQAEARRKKETAKKEEPSKSKLRQELGIEDDSDVYNTVLDTARKVLIRAYDAGKTVRQIQRDLTKEASVYLFKQVKNMLGTKAKYIPTITKLRVALINSMFTSDLVQMERNVADDQRVFTRFVGKLTSKKEVEDAVNRNDLPPSALNTIDKGQSVNLYEKIMPTEEQFVAFFDQPLVNPKTGVRSGLRGTRKDQLAKYVAASLNFDATMQVAQEPEVAEKRQQIAELRGEIIDDTDIQILSATINRDPSIKFSLTGKQLDKETFANKNLVEHLNIALKDPKLKTKEDYIEYASKAKRIVGPGSKTMSSKDKSIIAELAYKMSIDKRYARPVDKKLGDYLLNKILQAKKNNKVTNAGIENENKDRSILQKYFPKTANFINGIGDTYIAFSNVIFGFESKLGIAQGVSQLLSYTKQGINFPNKNQTSNDSQVLFDDIIGEKMLKVREKINKHLKDYYPNVDLITDFTKELTSEQIEAIKPFRHLFMLEEQVSLDYIMSAYANGKYKKQPQGFIIIEGKLYRLQTGNKKVDDNTSVLTEEFFNETGVEIPNLAFNAEKASSIDVVANMDIVNGKIKFRLRPLILSENFIPSEVDINNETIAKGLGKSAEKANSKIQFSITKKAVENSRPVIKYSKTSRGMSTFDFDETLIDRGENFILATSPDGKQIKITSSQWPIQGPKLAEQGYTFDFKDFVNVRGGVAGPLLQKLKNRIKKYGPKNNYILTARPPESATAIHEWLKTKGITIPIENITGLGNSTGEAKAMWMASKYAEGYNDMYFVDDALPNVKAVKDLMNQLDIKGKSVQAKIKFSNSLDNDFNKILDDVTGIDAKKRFSDAKARARGRGKGRFRFFVPPSHEDFVGLLYNFIGFGEKGNKHRDFFEKALIRPLNRAFRELNVAKQAIANDYRNLVKSMPQVRKRLGEKILKGDYTVEDAIRVYLFDKAGFEIPGLTKTDLKNLTDFVKNDIEILQFAEQISKISRVEEGYVSPGDSWQASNIRYDLVDATGRVGRAKFFTEFQENVDIIFSDENMNKIRAAFGDNFVEALQDMLYRIKTGSNRPAGNNRIVNKFLDWINGSVGATMFFNARSAVLQTLSTVNFINFGDNNIFKAAAAFANQKQFWSDFAALFNSDFLKQRRSGAAFDVNANEIAREVAGSKNPVLAAIKYLLNIGFLPTQLADSFAIASGGATFYRNRIKTYLKQGLSQKEAESKAFIDFQEIAEATQQSARPDMVSQQQTSTLGRIILAFQNVTAQYARLIKKAGLDLVNRRISRGYQTQVQSDMSNISRIIYYGAIQAVIFNALQNALFAMMFDEEEEDEEKTKKFFDTKKQRVINGTIDSLLKGLGVGGAIVSTLKNYAIKLTDNLENKSFFKTPAWEELLQLSPPIGIKIRKIARAEKNLEWNKDVLTELPLDNLDNPIYETSATYIEGFTNVPTARLLRKIQNLNAALDSENKWWQRVAVAAGWSRWDVGIQDNEIKEIKNAIRENNKRINEETKLKQATPEEKLKIVEKSVFDLSKNEQIKILDANNLNPKKYPKEADRVDAIMNLRNKNERKIDSTINAIENYIPTEKEQRSIDLFKMNKKDQVNMLIDFGLTPKQIRELKYEEDRVNKIIQLENKRKSKK